MKAPVFDGYGASAARRVNKITTALTAAVPAPPWKTELKKASAATKQRHLQQNYCINVYRCMHLCQLSAVKRATNTSDKSDGTTTGND